LLTALAFKTSRELMPNQITVVTGAARFIGFHVAQRILQSGQPVLGLARRRGAFSTSETIGPKS
jgi:NADP-dependent 3-hydroxy acid dehydrogenase YdfG